VGLLFSGDTEFQGLAFPARRDYKPSPRWGADRPEPGGVWVGRRGPAVETGGPYAGLRPVWGGSVHWGGELGQAATCGRPLGKPATEDGWDAEE